MMRTKHSFLTKELKLRDYENIINYIHIITSITNKSIGIDIVYNNEETSDLKSNIISNVPSKLLV